MAMYINKLLSIQNSIFESELINFGLEFIKLNVISYSLAKFTTLSSSFDGFLI